MWATVDAASSHSGEPSQRLSSLMQDLQASPATSLSLSIAGARKQTLLIPAVFAERAYEGKPGRRHDQIFRRFAHVAAQRTKRQRYDK
jgi:hypothetical protein